MSPTDRTLSERICYVHQQSGLSEEAFAERIGASLRSLHRWMAGDGTPPRKALVAMASEFGYRLNWLLKGSWPRELPPLDADVLGQAQSAHATAAPPPEPSGRPTREQVMEQIKRMERLDVDRPALVIKGIGDEPWLVVTLNIYVGGVQEVGGVEFRSGPGSTPDTE